MISFGKIHKLMLKFVTSLDPMFRHFKYFGFSHGVKKNCTNKETENHFFLALHAYVLSLFETFSYVTGTLEQFRNSIKSQ